MKKILSFILVLIMVLGLLAGCGSGNVAESATTTATSTENAASDASAETTAEYKPVEWKLSHNGAEGSAMSDCLAEMAEAIGEATEGRVTVVVYPNNVLGADTSTRDMLIEGTIDMLSLGEAWMNSYLPATELSSLLYLCENYQEMAAIIAGWWGEKYYAEPLMSELNIRLLNDWGHTGRHLMSTKPVYTVDDLSGMKLRIPTGYNVWDTTWTKLGALTVFLDLTDTFTGLSQGAVDAVEMPAEYLYTYKFYEVAKYVTKTSHLSGGTGNMLLVNENAWQSISPEDQAIIEEVADKYHDIYVERLLSDEQKMFEALEAEGVTIIELTDEQRAGFSAYTDEVASEFADAWGQECYDDFIKARDEYRAANG